MDRGLLEEYLDAGLSLIEIGALTNRDPSTVGYWVQKHGLVANGRDKFSPRGGLTREQLEPLWENGATLQQIAGALDRSVPTVRYWLKRYGLHTRHNGGWRSAEEAAEIEQAVAEGRRVLVRRCRRHGETEFAIVDSGRRLRCKRCRSEAVVRRRRRVKEILVAEAGGRCVLCGYDKHPGALEFHHLDPSTKRFAVSRRGITRSIDEVREEAQKCALVCANCHAELEGGVTELPVK